MPPTDEDIRRINSDVREVRERVREQGNALAAVQSVHEEVHNLAEKVETLTTAVNIRMSDHAIESATRGAELTGSIARAHEKIEAFEKSKESGRQNWLSIVATAVAVLAIIAQLALSAMDRSERAVERAKFERTLNAKQP